MNPPATDADIELETSKERLAAAVALLRTLKETKAQGSGGFDRVRTAACVFMETEIERRRTRVAELEEGAAHEP